MTAESVLLKRVMLEASKLGLRVFRNNVGKLKDANGRYVTYGLCIGSSDLIGWDKDGKFIALEVKIKGGIVSDEQANFITQVKKSGGFAAVIRDEKDLKNMLDNWRNMPHKYV